MLSSSHPDHNDGTHSHLSIPSGVGRYTPPTLSAKTVSWIRPSTSAAPTSPPSPSALPRTLPRSPTTSPAQDSPYRKLFISAAVDSRELLTDNTEATLTEVHQLTWMRPPMGSPTCTRCLPAVWVRNTQPISPPEQALILCTGADFVPTDVVARQIMSRSAITE